MVDIMNYEAYSKMYSYYYLLLAVGLNDIKALSTVSRSLRVCRL